VDVAARRSRRVVVAVSLWLLVVPALLLAVRTLLPADDVVTVPAGQSVAAGGVALAPAGRVAGLHPGDVLLGRRRSAGPRPPE
jgi:hypothetical protein